MIGANNEVEEESAGLLFRTQDFGFMIFAS